MFTQEKMHLLDLSWMVISLASYSLSHLSLWVLGLKTEQIFYLTLQGSDLNIVYVDFALEGREGPQVKRSGTSVLPLSCVRSCVTNRF